MATENVIKLAKHSSRIPSHLLHIKDAYWNLKFRIFTQPLLLLVNLITVYFTNVTLIDTGSVTSASR